MIRHLKTNNQNMIILQIGKVNMKATILIDSGQPKHYVVNYHKDLKTWRDLFSKKRKSLTNLKYRAARKILFDIYKDTGVNKFTVWQANIDKTETDDLLINGDILTVKKLFKKIDLEIVEVIKLQDSGIETESGPMIIDKGSLNTSCITLSQGFSFDTGKYDKKTVR